MEAIVERSRTGARFEVIVKGERPFAEVLRTSSRDADLVFLGLAEPAEGFLEYYERMQARLEGLPSTVLVLAAEDLKFGEVLLEPERPERR